MQEFRRALHETDRGTILAIEVTAGSKRENFPGGFNPWRNTLDCIVTAPPVEGRANRAVVELISRSLDVPKNRISILSGSGSAQKKIMIEGIGAEALASILEKLL